MHSINQAQPSPPAPRPPSFSSELEAVPSELKPGLLPVQVQVCTPTPGASLADCKLQVCQSVWGEEGNDLGDHHAEYVAFTFPGYPCCEQKQEDSVSSAANEGLSLAGGTARVTAAALKAVRET